MNIAQHVEQGRALFPERAALCFEGETFSYQQLDDLSSRIAHGLAQLGIGRGDRVALLLPNHPAFVSSYLGILKLGAIVVAVNPALKAEEIAFIVNDSGAQVIITTASSRAQLNADPLPQLAHILIAEGEGDGDRTLAELIGPDRIDDQPFSWPAVEMQAAEPAAILYTSGTTGFPKGAVLSHGNILSNGHACWESFGLQPTDRVLLCLPAFHCFGQNAAMNPCFMAGATLVLQRQFEVNSVLRAIAEEEITIFFGVPTLYLLLYEQAALAQLHSLRRCISAAATLSTELAHKWQNKYGFVINEGYGLTETCLNTFNHAVRYQPGSVGTPQAGISLRVVNPAGDAVAVGELGEVTVRGPNVMGCYWQRAGETAAVLRDGWFYTGDIGRLDDDGYLYIVDRVKDMINVGGTKVYPSEVENILYRHPAVAEAAVYGVADDLFGEQVAASLILHPGRSLTAADLQHFCGQYLADFKTPILIEFVDTLPKGRTGKILKRVLRTRWQPHPQPAVLPNHSADRQQGGRSVTAPAITAWLVDWVARQMALDLQAVDTDRPMAEFGMTSVLAVKLTAELGVWLGRAVPPIVAWNFPTIAALARYLSHHQTQDDQPQTELGNTTPTAMVRAFADHPPQATPEELSTLSIAELEALLVAEIRTVQERKLQ